MNLRRQLFLVSLLTLALPWAGCTYVRTVEQDLLAKEMAVVEATAAAHVAFLSTQPQWMDAEVAADLDVLDKPVLYASVRDRPAVLDGYKDDLYVTAPARPFDNSSADFSATLWSVKSQNLLQLLIAVDNPQLKYFSPYAQDQDYDHIELQIQSSLGLERYVFTTSAPGVMSVEALARDAKSSVSAVWVETEKGYQVELTIDLSRKPLVEVQLYVQNANAEQLSLASTVDFLPLVHRHSMLETLLAQTAVTDARLVLLNSQRWILAEQTRDGAISARPISKTLIQRLLRWVLGELDFARYPVAAATNRMSWAPNHQQTQTRFTWFVDGQNLVAQTVKPILFGPGRQALYVYERSYPSVDTMVQSALSGLAWLSLLVVGLVLGGLLGYASFLSYRITRLRDDVAKVVDEHGRLTGTFAASSGQDEISELSRSFDKLFKKQQEHNQYLETLASKLSHELRTPLAIVRSSLENLSAQIEDQHASIYVDRADQAAARLSAILKAMVEASRLEHSIFASTKQSFEVTPFLQELSESYRSLFAQKGLLFEADLAADPTAQSAVLIGSPDLLAQALDKLLDNAADFAEPSEPITLSSRVADGAILIAVSNVGQALPQTNASALFEALVTRRAEADVPQETSAHMGLGLYVVKLVAQWHLGDVTVRQEPALGASTDKIYETIFEFSLPLVD